MVIFYFSSVIIITTPLSLSRLLGVHQCAYPPFTAAADKSFQVASKEILRLRNINCTVPEQICLEK